ncbi:MAG: CAP domain-containing protein [Treponema sp.]|nr:CAP domain-containing protein [Treponema sp.]
MKKIFMLPCALLLALSFFSCSDDDGTEETDYSALTETTYSESVWNTDELDTARSVSGILDFEKDAILELNKARTNPKAYAALYILPMKDTYKGTEGNAALIECLSEMSKLDSLGTLNFAQGLYECAKEHADSSAAAGAFSHTRVDGTETFAAFGKYGTYSSAGENIAAGQRTVRDVVVDLLIDDGIESRGHRKNILSSSFDSVGVGYSAQHTKYTTMWVFDFASNWVDK